MVHFRLLTLLVILGLFSQNRALSEVYHIIPNPSNHCATQPCLTLSQFAANSSHYLHSNTTLDFLPGIHNLSKIILMLVNVKYLIMKSVSSTAIVMCTNDSNIHFSQSQSIHITNLEFIGCGGNQVKNVKDFLVYNTKFEGQENSETALELIGTTAQIFDSMFVSNRKGVYRHCILFDPDRGCILDGFIGGVIFANSNSNITISQSRFEDNRADFGGAIFTNSSIISMSGNVFNNNSVTYGGGGLSFNNSAITVNASIFSNNHAAIGGGALSSFNSTVTIEASEFHDNIATNTGGVLVVMNSTITIKISNFNGNSAYRGGVLYSLQWSTITIEASEFDGNYAYWGGVLASLNTSTFMIKVSKFNSNSATLGGVLDFANSSIIIEGDEFSSNRAYWGGVLYSDSSNIIVEGSEFSSNIGINGGVYCFHENNNITLGDCNFTNNSASIGAVVYALYDSKIHYHHSLLIDNNLADEYAVIYLAGSEIRGCNSGDFIFSNNFGSLVAFNSNVTFSGYAIFIYNHQPSQTTIGAFQEGGAITLFQSNMYFDGECNLEHNNAENGGVMHSTESKLYVNGNVTIAHNRATVNGGGFYLSSSELNCQQESTLVLYNNTAMNKGGGLHAISSSIKASSNIEDFVSDHNNTDYIQYTGTRIYLINNEAKLGGGLSLAANAKLDILKYNGIPPAYYEFIDIITAIFTGNSADYGGAMYVDDDTNSGTCASNPKTECFFQVLGLYVYDYTRDDTIRGMNFSQNNANFLGSTLYGGLLDRCAVSPFAEVYKKYAPDDVDRGGGIAYFRLVSTITNISISSGPVRVCLCTCYSIHNCTNQNRVDVKKGETFPISLVAVDQVSRPVSATIQASLSSAESGLAEGQLAKNISAKCTNLTFNVVSPHDSEILALYASDGPCRNAELSRAVVEIHFLPCSCPIGLQVSANLNNTNCTCECHSDISQYIEQCNSYNGSLVKWPQSRAWISYINDRDLIGYLVYPNCPFDYCLSTSPPFYLNQPNGADAQCAFNRSSLLCGSCRPGLSLSLGSSHCLPCPSYWPALLIAITIAAILAGIALVTLLLVLNMTVAVGTLNGLIFYANVVYMNKSILLPFQETNFITVFISWLNLDLGIDTCYFPGVNTYIKVWLQFVFPAYVIFLVVLVIIISSYSTKFSNLIGKKDPVATLATLILFSYSKLLEICFNSLSVGVLKYPDSSLAMMWLPDATVKYLSEKHIALFITAVLILLVGLIYTALLFLWQCLLYLPKWRIFKWSRNPRTQIFIETYHIPYTPKHRYWTGLLLIVRVTLYLTVAINVSNDPSVALTVITFTVGCVVLLKGFIGSRLYKNWLLDMLENVFYLNIFFCVVFIWYCLSCKNYIDPSIAYTSVTITVIVLLLIILYHVYMYTSLFSIVKKTRFGRRVDRLFTDTAPKPKPRQRHYSPSPPPDNSNCRFDDCDLLDELDCPVYTGDYDTTPLLRPPPVKPTFSVVELSHPRLLTPDPEGANTQNSLVESEERGGGFGNDKKK